MSDLNESRKTIAAYVYGRRWLRIAERVTKSDGSLSVRNLVGMSPTLEAAPRSRTDEQLAEIHANTVAIAGPAPAESELADLGTCAQIVKRLRSLSFGAAPRQSTYSPSP